LEKEKSRGKLLSQEEELEIYKRRVKRLETELKVITGSRGWVLLESLRTFFYQTIPSFFSPVLRLFKKLLRVALYNPLVRIGLRRDDYERWRADETSLCNPDIISKFSHLPLFSIVIPVYNVKPQWLELAVGSVLNQSYPHWEICLADDCSTDKLLHDLLVDFTERDKRIKVRFLEKNVGIAGASNAALGMSEGDYVGLLDNDDELTQDALLEVAKSINDNPGADLIYSDEDKISESGKRYAPFFKPDFSPDTLRSYNYLCHFTVIRKTVLDKIGGFRVGYDGSQDYDLFLRVIDEDAKIVHIPKVLYHWRAISGSVGKEGTAKMYAYDSAKKALADHLQRVNLDAEIVDGLFLGSYHIKYRISAKPEVAIIIPNRDKVEVLERCVNSILNKTTYKNYRIYIVENRSREQATFELYDRLKEDPRVQLIEFDQEFNFSALNNFAVEQIDTEYILFLNNDTEVIAPAWIEEMLGLCQRPDVGAVGSLLYYPDKKVQHGGIILGIGGIAGHSHKYFSHDAFGYFGRIKVTQNLSAVTAACLMTKKDLFLQVEGFDTQLSHAFNDVDLCLKIRKEGFLIVYTPYAELYHYESITRGYENTYAKRARFNQEKATCEDKWGATLEKCDPYYNPNLTLLREDFSLKP